MNKKLNNLILKSIYYLIIILIIYISILIINKLDIVPILLNIIKLLSPLIIGIIITWLLKPIINYLVNKNINRLFSIIIIYILIISIIYISIVTFVPIFIKELIEFIHTIPNLINNITSSIKIIKIDGFINNISNNVNKTINNVPLTCIEIIKDMSNIIIGFIIAFYLLIENYTIDYKKYLKKNTYNLFININIILRNYVKGTLLAALIVFISSTILFYILGLDSALFLGFICGITNIIPFIGPYIGAVIPVLIAFTKNTTFGILVAVVIVIIQTIEGNIIQPLIMKKSINVHPVVSIISLIIFGYFFGIIGMVVALPLVAIIKELYIYFSKKYNLRS